MIDTRLKLTVDQYEAMVAKGAFDELPQKIELIDGEIQAMNPAGPVHDDLLEYLTHWSLRSTDEDRVRVRIQSGLSLPECSSRPEPDVLWVKAEHPRGRHPQAHEVLLVIEVADSSPDIDRTTKADLYARAMIPDYWVVNSAQRLLHVYRAPSPRGYGESMTLKPGETAVPLAVPEARLELHRLFGGN